MLERTGGQPEPERPKIVPFRRSERIDDGFELVDAELPQRPPEDPFFYLKQEVLKAAPNTQPLWQTAYAARIGRSPAPVIVHDAREDANALPTWNNIRPLSRARATQVNPIVIRFTASADLQEAPGLQRAVEVPLPLLAELMDIELRESEDATEMLQQVTPLLTWYAQNPYDFQERIFERFDRMLNKADPRLMHGPTEQPLVYWWTSNNSGEVA